MDGLARYRRKVVTATIKKVRSGQQIRQSDGTFVKTGCNKCFLLTDDLGEVRLITKGDLDCYVLMSGSKINHFRDLPMYNPVEVRRNDDSFFWVYFAKKRESVNIKDYDGMTKTVTAEEGDAIVYSIDENGMPDMDSVRCIKKEVFLAQYEAA